MSAFTEDGTDIFDWQGIKIFQHETVHKVGTDAVLLASWTAHLLNKVPSNILDAGTGSGILALMMAKTFPTSRIYAVDIDQEALRLATLNASVGSANTNIIVEYENILAVPSAALPVFNLIISNPPFYTTTNLPESEFKARAKHSSVQVADWMIGLVSRLSEIGEVCIIVPSEAAAKWISAANQLGYYNQHRMEVFSFDADPKPKRTLLHFGTKLTRPTISRMVIYAHDHHYTQAYLNLTSIRPGR